MGVVEVVGGYGGSERIMGGVGIVVLVRGN